MKWINTQTSKPEPLTDDRLTFVLISWPGEDDFRDYAVMYYAPCDKQWWMSNEKDDIPFFDYWCYISNPTIIK